MEPGKLYMQRIDWNRNISSWPIRDDPAATIVIWLGISTYDWYRNERVSRINLESDFWDGVIVREFWDVVRATRQFG